MRIGTKVYTLAGALALVASQALAQPMAAGSVALPLLKAGFWQVNTQGQGVNVNSQMCLDEAIQKEMSVLGQNMSVGRCSDLKISGSSLSGYKTHTTCDLGMGSMQIDGILSGDLKTSYKNVTTVTSTVSGQKNVDVHTATGTYKGACPSGFKPGDIAMDGGMRMNLRELSKMGDALKAVQQR